jgi:hypothetical protein
VNGSCSREGSRRRRGCALVGLCPPSAQPRRIPLTLIVAPQSGHPRLRPRWGPKYELLARHVLNLLQKTLPPEATKLLAILVTAEIPSPGSRGIVWVCEGLATAAVAALAILAGAARGPLLRLPTLAFLGRISYPQSHSGRPLRDGRGGGGSRGLSRLAIGGIPDWCRHRYHGRRVRGLSCRQRTAYVSCEPGIEYRPPLRDCQCDVSSFGPSSQLRCCIHVR